MHPGRRETEKPGEMQSKKSHSLNSTTLKTRLQKQIKNEASSFKQNLILTLNLAVNYTNFGFK